MTNVRRKRLRSYTFWTCSKIPTAYSLGISAFEPQGESCGGNVVMLRLAGWNTFTIKVKCTERSEASSSFGVLDSSSSFIGRIPLNDKEVNCFAIYIDFVKYLRNSAYGIYSEKLLYFARRNSWSIHFLRKVLTASGCGLQRGARGFHCTRYCSNRD